MDPTLLIGTGLLVGQWAVVAPGPAIAGSVVSIVLARRRLGRAGVVLFVIAAALAAFRAWSALGAFDRARAAAIAELVPPGRCEGKARVTGSPVRMRSADETRMVYDARIDEVSCEGRPAGPLRARLYGGPEDLARGDTGSITMDLGPIQILSNEGLADPRPRAARRGIVASGRLVDWQPVDRAAGPAALVDRMRSRVRARIDATFAPPAAPFARALVLGESDLDPGDDQAFRTSGLAHLLAVSGTHLLLVVVTLVTALTAILTRITALSARHDVGRIAAAVGIGLAWAYADFAGGSGSAWRAAAMLSAAFAARAAGRQPNGRRAFGLSIVAGALIDPLTGYDASFMLSVAATAGLTIWKRPVAQALASAAPRRLGSLLTDGFATTLTASVGCAPYLLLISPTLPVGGLFANLLAVPIGEYAALPLCLAHALLSPLPLAEQGAAIVASGSLLLVRAIAHATTEIPCLAVAVPTPSAWHLAVLAATVAAAWASTGPRRRAAVLGGIAVLALVEVATLRAGAPRGKLRITFLDVGQGDAAVIDLPNGGAILVDAGGTLGAGADPGAAVVAPVLRARRRNSLDVAVLTHPHPDHVGGMPAALAAVRVGELWDNGQGREGAPPAYDALLALLAKSDVKVRGPADLCRGPRVIGGATVEVLAPCPGIDAFADPNENSIVMRIGLGRRFALLMGDAPTSVEQKLLAQGEGRLRADILKVGHHGSRTATSPALLEAVRPAHAVVSLGVRNRFGHPFAGTIALLSARATVWRTDRHGSIVWETDGDGVQAW